MAGDFFIIRLNISNNFQVAESYCIDGKANLTIRNVNKHLSALQSECIENNNISSQYLGQKG